MPITMIFPSRNSVRHPDPGGAERPLSIGLLNNMPDGALESTERQFVNLLTAASSGFAVRLSLYYLPGIPRSPSALAFMGHRYSSADLLPGCGLDALIVTGREPLSPRLQDEPYLDNFVRVLEWAQENTCSTVWSCLAAHAAVLHMDGIERRRNPEKHCGVFECTRVSEHPVTAGLPAQFGLPHSRWNGLPEHELTRRGYQVLTRTDGAGVDCFIRQAGSLFLFFQGHPEYEANTLLLEYRRDVIRYLRGEITTYPNLPHNYFDRINLDKLTEIQQGIAARPHEEIIAMLATLQPSITGKRAWSGVAARLYENWLRYIHQEKAHRIPGGRSAAACTPPVVRDPKQAMQVELIASAKQE
jgi:homoserine O-succinyltransferase/O-acetyltransferase